MPPSQNQQIEAKLTYSFGSVIIKVSEKGDIDRPHQLLDHMLSTAVAVTAAEVVQHGISDNQSENGALRQPCVATVKFGDIEITAEIDFDLVKRISKRELNSMAFDSILPKILQTAARYLGDNRTMTTPPAPLASQSRRDVRDSVDTALGLGEPVVDYGSPQNGHRSTQLVGAH